MVKYKKNIFPSSFLTFFIRLKEILWIKFLVNKFFRLDVNECQINNHDCLETQRCDNTIGSYTCIRLQSCGTGYTLNAGTGYCDGMPLKFIQLYKLTLWFEIYIKKTLDDDECALGRHNCVAPYECRNTKGSFRCDRPRYTPSVHTTTASTTSSTTTSTTTTRRPVSQQTIYLPPQVYRYNTPNPYESSQYTRNSEYDRYSGPCDVGFVRNTQGACVGKFRMFGWFILLLLINLIRTGRQTQ